MGRTECNLRRPTPPVMWNQIPAYYPRLLYGTGIQKKHIQCVVVCVENLVYRIVAKKSVDWMLILLFKTNKHMVVVNLIVCRRSYF